MVTQRNLPDQSLAGSLRSSSRTNPAAQAGAHGLQYAAIADRMRVNWMADPQRGSIAHGHPSVLSLVLSSVLAGISEIFIDEGL
jgi:hypothetical protein